MGGSCDAIVGAECERSAGDNGTVSECSKKIEPVKPLKDLLDELRPEHDGDGVVVAPN